MEIIAPEPKMPCKSGYPSALPAILQQNREPCKCDFGHEAEIRLKKFEDEVKNMPTCPYMPKKKKKQLPEVPEPEDDNIIVVVGELNAKDKANYFAKQRQIMFREKGERLSMLREIEWKVQAAAACADEILDKKRRALKNLFLNEEAEYIKEYVKVCQKATQDREAELEQKQRMLKEKIDKEQQEYVQKRLLEAKVNNCEELRPMMIQKRNIQTRKDQLWQIEAKNALWEARREEDKMYHDCMVKNMLAMRESDEEYAKKLWQKQRDFETSFAEQKKWKFFKEQEIRDGKERDRLQLEEQARTAAEADRKANEDRLQRNAQARKEWEEFLRMQKEIKDKREAEERARDQQLLTLAMDDLKRMNDQASGDKQRRRAESELFRASLEKMKIERAAEEKRCYAMNEELIKKKADEKCQDKKRLMKYREEQLSETMKTREQQIRERQERQQREKEAEARELELLRLQLEQHDLIAEDHMRRECDKKKAYTKTLLDQMEENAARRRKEKQDTEDFLKYLRQWEEDNRQKVLATMEGEMIGAVHPIRAFVTSNDPKFVCPTPCTQK